MIFTSIYIFFPYTEKKGVAIIQVMRSFILIGCYTSNCSPCCNLFKIGSIPALVPIPAIVHPPSFQISQNISPPYPPRRHNPSHSFCFCRSFFPPSAIHNYPPASHLFIPNKLEQHHHILRVPRRYQTRTMNVSCRSSLSISFHRINSQITQHMYRHTHTVIHKYIQGGPRQFTS